MYRVKMIAACASTMAIAAVLCAGTASAQDMNPPVIYAEPAAQNAVEAVEQPVLKPTIDDTQTAANPLPKSDMSSRWTGFYAGLSGGYGMVWDSLEAKANGADYGGFAGYNIPIRGAIVAGLEAEYMHIGRTFDDGSGVIANETFTAKARLGYAHDKFFAYGLVGAQHATSDVTSIGTFYGIAGLKEAKDTALVLGLGVDVAVTDRVSIGAEYSRAYYSDFDFGTLPFHLDVSVQRANARLSYKIN
jgi:outer membrane immunogenic protein